MVFVAVPQLILVGCVPLESVHLTFGRAKHDRRQFINDRQRFTTVMLPPYEYINWFPGSSLGTHITLALPRWGRWKGRQSLPLSVTRLESGNIKSGSV
ncbi:MAG: hypothetical protein ACM65M_04355 [Microcoleus sp.]